MSSEPTTTPSRSTRLPLAARRNSNLPTPVTTSGYTTPVRTVITTIIRTEVPRCFHTFSSTPFSDPAQRDQHEIDRLDADERSDQASAPVDPQVAPQQPRRSQRAVADAAQRERHERQDDERVEDDGGEDRAPRCREPHHV